MTRAAATEAITEAVPLIAHTQGILDLSLSSEKNQAMPPGKGIPIRNPMGAVVRAVITTRKGKGKPNVMLIRNGKTTGMQSSNTLNRNKLCLRGNLLLHLLPNPENRSKANKTAVKA
jgi:hypothetical protein